MGFSLEIFYEYNHIFITKLVHNLREKKWSRYIQCPKCKSKKGYLLGIGKRRLVRCLYGFLPHRLPLYPTKEPWKEIISWFLPEQSSQTISLRTSIERGRVLRALTIIRRVLTKDISDILSGIIEVSETYSGGQWRNKRKVIRDQRTKRGRGTKKQPVFGILYRNGTVWSEVVNDVEAATLQPLISWKVSPGSIVCSDTWRAYTGIAAKGYVHRLVNHGERLYTDGKGNHINGLGGFWGYLKRKLASKGGIRQEKWPLYYSEYVWRYNHRKEIDEVKIRRILKMLELGISGYIATIPYRIRNSPVEKAIKTR